MCISHSPPFLINCENCFLLIHNDELVVYCAHAGEHYAERIERRNFLSEAWQDGGITAEAQATRTYSLGGWDLGTGDPIAS